MEALVGTFEVSVDYVDAYLIREKHSLRRCACDSCRWLRNAQRLLREYHKTSITGAYKSL